MVIPVNVVSNEEAHGGTDKHISGRMTAAANTSDCYGRGESIRDDGDDNGVRKFSSDYPGERPGFDRVP